MSDGFDLLCPRRRRLGQPVHMDTKTKFPYLGIDCQIIDVIQNPRN
jgi:hypothetical protein